MPEERVRVDDPDIPSDCAVYEVRLDGRSIGFVVVGPGGEEYRASTLAEAFEIAAGLTRQPRPR